MIAVAPLLFPLARHNTVCKQCGLQICYDGKFSVLYEQHLLKITHDIVIIDLLNFVVVIIRYIW